MYDITYKNETVDLSSPNSTELMSGMEQVYNSTVNHTNTNTNTNTNTTTDMLYGMDQVYNSTTNHTNNTNTTDVLYDGVEELYEEELELLYTELYPEYYNASSSSNASSIFLSQNQSELFLEALTEHNIEQHQNDATYYDPYGRNIPWMDIYKQLDAYNYPKLTHNQTMAVAYTPKVTAFLSILGSSWIIYELCLRDKRRQYRKLKTTYHRLLLAMSLVDVLSSVWLFIGTWAIPASLNNHTDIDYSVEGASGNTATCEAQGFFLTLGVATPLYNASLSIYSVLVARYGWKESRIQKPVMQYSMLGIPILFALTCAVVGLWTDMYNLQPSTYNCWIAPFPIRCDPYIFDREWKEKEHTLMNHHDGHEDDHRPECVRGHNANEFKLFSVFWPLWISSGVMCICMILVIAKVFQLERATNRWRTQFDTTTTPTPTTPAATPTTTPTTTPPSTTTTTTKNDRRRSTWTRNDSVFTWTIGKQKDRNSTTPPTSPANANTTTQTNKAKNQNLFNLLFGKSKKSRKVVAQAFFFVSAFYLTWMPYMGYNLYRYIHQLYVFDDKFVALWLSSTMMPAQGLFNFLVYMRPRYILYQEQRQHKQKRKQKRKRKRKRNSRKKDITTPPPTTKGKKQTRDSSFQAVYQKLASLFSKPAVSHETSVAPAAAAAAVTTAAAADGVTVVNIHDIECSSPPSCSSPLSSSSSRLRNSKKQYLHHRGSADIDKLNLRSSTTAGVAIMNENSHDEEQGVEIGISVRQILTDVQTMFVYGTDTDISTSSSSSSCQSSNDNDDDISCSSHDDNDDDDVIINSNNKNSNVSSSSSIISNNNKSLSDWTMLVMSQPMIDDKEFSIIMDQLTFQEEQEEEENKNTRTFLEEETEEEISM